MIRVLVACEESQEVCKAFRARGFEAYSCDIQECSGGHPEWHIKGDALMLINGSCSFTTMDGCTHTIEGKWDLMIAHPPCTDLCVSGARHFEKKRANGRQEKSIKFFAKFLEADCNKIAIENPVGIISGEYILKWFPDLAKEYNMPLKPSQIIQHYEFGHPYTKKTCLWLVGLPELKKTDVLTKPSNGWVNQSFTSDGRYGGYNGKFNTAKQRSKTFPNIAQAMAEQWGNYLMNERGKEI